MVKSTCSCRGPVFYTQCSQDGSQPSVTPVPENPKYSPDLRGTMQVHGTTHTNMQAKHIKYINLIVVFNRAGEFLRSPLSFGEVCFNNHWKV